MTAVGKEISAQNSRSHGLSGMWQTERDHQSIREIREICMEEGVADGVADTLASAIVYFEKVLEQRRVMWAEHQEAVYGADTTSSVTAASPIMVTLYHDNQLKACMGLSDLERDMWSFLVKSTKRSIRNELELRFRERSRSLVYGRRGANQLIKALQHIV